MIIYPDDDNKPPVGVGLNRKAQVTLDRVWPHDKNKHEPITDPGILQQIDYEEKLRRVCAKHDTRFLEYRPQTGSWVFKVNSNTLLLLIEFYLFKDKIIILFYRSITFQNMV